VPDTAAMWLVLRLLALAVIAAGALLLAGHGAWPLDALDALVPGVDIAALPRTEAAPTWPQLAAGAVAGLAVSVVPLARQLTAQLTTLVHELGHTVVAAALGGRPAGIVLRHDASGHASSRWRARATPLRRLALATVAFVGLPAPAVATAVAAHLLLLGGPRTVLWVLAAAGVVVALLARSAWSLLVAGGLVAMAAAALTEAAAPWATGVVLALLGAVIVGVLRDCGAVLRRGVVDGEDAQVVARHVWLPARLVQLLQLAVATALVGWTAWLLLTAPLD
jgi:hypothetical protein